MSRAGSIVPNNMVSVPRDDLRDQATFGKGQVDNRYLAAYQSHKACAGVQAAISGMERPYL